MMQTIYINQLLAAHQMSNCNTASISIVKKLYLTPTSNNFELLLADVIVYKHFTGSI